MKGKVTYLYNNNMKRSSSSDYEYAFIFYQKVKIAF